jgi:hypothetical protein
MWLLVAAAVSGGVVGTAGDVQDGYETAAPTWTVAPGAGRLIAQERSAVSPHRGQTCERISIESLAGTPLRVEFRTSSNPYARDR